VSLFSSLGRLFGGARAPQPPPGTKTPAATSPVRPNDARLLAYVHPGAAYAFAVSPDGQFVAIAGSGYVDRERRKHEIFKEHFKAIIDSPIALFPIADLVSGKAAEPALLQEGHTGPVACIVWDHEGTLWSGGGDRYVRRHEVDAGVQSGAWQRAHDTVLALKPLWRTDDAPAPQAAAAPIVPEASATGQAVASADQGAPAADAGGTADAPLDAGWFLQAARAAQAPGHSHDHGHEHHEHTADASPETPAAPAPHRGATHVLTVSADRYLRLIDLRTGREARERRELGKHLLIQAAFVADDAIAICNQDGLLRVIGEDGDARGEERFVEPLYALASHPDGATFWSGDRVGTLRRHNASGQTVASYTPISGARILAIAPSPDGTRVAVGNLRGELAEIDAATGEVVRTMPPLAQRVTALAYLGGQLIASDYNGFMYRV